jgi:hypothetical protein
MIMNAIKESSPLMWPEGWPRTLIGNREPRPAWKKTDRQSIDALELELKRFGAVAPMVTRKDPQDFRTAPDPSVAVWFSRQREEDFTWQSALGINNPAPSIEEIETAFRRLAQKYHPDNQTTGDLETYHALDKQKKNALAYVNRLSGVSHDYSIACDKFKEARWNINAIRMTVHSLRQMERDGTSMLLERALRGFTAIPEKVPDREIMNVHAVKTSA